MTPKVSLIAAVAANRVIGLNNTLPWHLPEDLQHFKALTLGKTVIMGRKTWDALRLRPLPNRHNIVISRQTSWQADGAATRAHSLEAALAKAAGAPDIFVIGGAEIYQQALPIASALYLTEIAQAFEGDTWFPLISKQQWRVLTSEEHISTQGIPFAFVEYSRA